MNAKQRRKFGRFHALVKVGRSVTNDRARAEHAEIEATLCKDRICELEAKVVATEQRLAAVLRERDDVLSENRDLEDFAAGLRHEIQALASKYQLAEERHARTALELARLQEEDRDVAKLRRRLREAHEELAQTHERVRRLVAGRPDAWPEASAPAVPVGDEPPPDAKVAP